MRNKKLFQKLIDMTRELKPENFNMDKFNSEGIGSCGCPIHHAIRRSFLPEKAQPFGGGELLSSEDFFNIPFEVAFELFGHNEEDYFIGLERHFKTQTPEEQAQLMEDYLIADSFGVMRKNSPCIPKEGV